MQNPRTTLQPTQRFTNRVDDYVKYRPGYPQAMLAYLMMQYGLAPDHTVADVGSGTGLLAKLFLEHGNPVFGVEPNEAMRQAGEAFLADYPNFTSVAATAEATTLPDASVSWVTAGQAFHWFDPIPTKAEFRRILRPQGYIVLVWNTRHPDSPFLQAYDELLQKWAVQYMSIRHDTERDAAIGWFLDKQLDTATFENETRLDLTGLRGRALSSSYAPLPDHPHHESLIAGLDDLFARYQQAGRVSFLYQTELFIGR